MSIRKQLEAERARKILEAEREQRGVDLRRRALVLISLLFWPLLGFLVVGWGASTIRYVAYSRIIIEWGILLGLSGWLITLLISYDRRH